MKPRVNGHPIPNHRKAVRDYLLGRKNQLSALTGAGYSPKQARKGLFATLQTSGPLREAFENEINKLVKLAEILPSPHERANLVRFRLLMNVLSGKDAAVQSAKLLGQDKQVAMWEPETRTGVNIVVRPPAEWSARFLTTAEEG